MKTLRPFVRFAVALAALAISPTSARADLLEISDMFVFGDSLSDGGNSGMHHAGVHRRPDRRSSRRRRMPAGATRTAPPPSSSSGTCTTPTAGCGRRSRAARTSRSAVQRPALESFNEVNANVPPSAAARICGRRCRLAARAVPGLCRLEQLRSGNVALRRVAVPERHLLCQHDRRAARRRARIARAETTWSPTRSPIS